MKRKKRAPEGPADGVGKLWSLKGGMGSLTRKIGDVLGPKRLFQGVSVSEIEPLGPGWRMHFAGKQPTLLSRQVVLSTPAHASGELLSFHSGALGDLLMNWPYSGLVTVALAYQRDDVDHPLDGFGYLVPSNQGRPVLGCLFSSSIYPGVRAPEGQVLLRVMIGGERNPAAVDMDADTLIKVAENEVREVLGIRGKATMRQSIRWANALPQYNLGHERRVEKAKALVEEFCPGIILHSNAFHGIAVNDCTRASKELAGQLLN